MKERWIALILLIAGIGVGYFVYASEVNPESRFDFKLGLDLAGGTLLTYEADVSGLPDGEVDDAMQSLREVIERRVNLFGVSEPVVQTEQAGFGDDRSERLIVELPGVTDIDEAVRQLGETPLLEFKLLSQEALVQAQVQQQLALSSGATTTVDGIDPYQSTGLTGALLKRARLDFTSGGGHAGGGIAGPSVLLEFNSEGRDLFAEITRENVGEVLAIFLDGVPITEPVIRTAITDGVAVITGTFTAEEGREIVRDLNFGALPVPIELAGAQTIGATLGADTVDAGLQAGVWGLLLVALFLLLWYRLPGLMAVVALGIYVALMLALFKLIPVTLTAAGIAGFILSVGMAVDANILIFERMKEELQAGKKLRDAVELGFARAWLSIRDGNVTSILTAIILFYTTTSLVKGFALTFGLGVIVSMLTAITVTRTFLLACASEKIAGGWLFKTGIK